MTQQPDFQMHPTTPVAALRMHQRLSPGRQLFIQIVIGYAVMLPVNVIGMFVSGYYDGMLSLMGLTVLPAFQVGLALLIGSPLRLSSSLERWWRKYSWLGIFGLLAGIAAMAASIALGKYAPAVIEGVTYTLFNVDATLMLTGWMLLAFFSTHTWFARRGHPPHGTAVHGLPTRK